MIKTKRYTELDGWRVSFTYLALLLALILVLDEGGFKDFLETGGVVATVLYLGFRDWRRKCMWSATLMLSIGLYFLCC
jgi:hypothetical protein